MAEPRFWLNERDLELALADLGRELAYPPTPQLAVAVRRRLAEESPRPRAPRAWLPWLDGGRWRWLPWLDGRGWPWVPWLDGRGWPWVPRLDRRPWRWIPRPDRRFALALAAVLAVVAVVLAVSPDAREAVAERLGLRGVQIRQVPAVSAPRAAQLNLGEPLTLDQARARVAYQIEAPAALGPPDEVYLANAPVGGQVALVYYPRSDLPQASTTGVGALLTEFRGSVRSTAALGKGIPPGTRLEELQLNGGRAYWIEGDPHTFFYMDARGQIQTESTRLAANVLLWEHGELTLRLESALPRDAALAIAASVH